MAREIVVRTWCDVCLAGDVETEAEEVTLTAQGAHNHGPSILALCKAHHRELLAPLLEVLDEYGQPVDEEGNPANTRRKRTALPEGKKFQCPVCGKRSVSRGALDSHTRRHHDKPLSEVEGAPLAYTCPECQRGFTRPQGMAAHRKKAHGVDGVTKRTTAAGGDQELELEPVARAG